MSTNINSPQSWPPATRVLGSVGSAGRLRIYGVPRNRHR